MSSIHDRGFGETRQCAGAYSFVNVPTTAASKLVPIRSTNDLEPVKIRAASRLLGEMALIPIDLAHAQWGQMAGTDAAAAFIDAIRGIEDGRLTSFSYAPPEGVDGWQIALEPFEIDGERYANICYIEDTTSADTPSQLADHAADGERRRLGRELHDGASQYLIGLNLAIARLRTVNTDPAVDAIGQELGGLLDQLNSDLRAMAYLRYPPEIERLGLHEAIRLLCEGFSRRADIAFSLHFYGSDSTNSADVDTAVYRIVQEALANVYRHAQAHKVLLRVTNKGAAVEIVVQDDGVGLRRSSDMQPQLAPAGVGVAGMIARARELGGRLVFRNRRMGGTILGVTIPRLPTAWTEPPAPPFVERRAPPLTFQII